MPNFSIKWSIISPKVPPVTMSFTPKLARWLMLSSHIDSSPLLNSTNSFALFNSTTPFVSVVWMSTDPLKMATLTFSRCKSPDLEVCRSFLTTSPGMTKLSHSPPPVTLQIWTLSTSKTMFFDMMWHDWRIREAKWSS